ncbi:MAG TPA: FtsX-like permease family protein [Acidimicrobiales bacterium]
MGTEWLFARAEWRRHWGTLVFVAVVVAVGGGLVLASVAGARRADTAFERFLAATQTSNIDVTIDDTQDPAARASLFAEAERLAAIDGVRSVRRLTYLAAGIERNGQAPPGAFAVGMGPTFGEPQPTYVVLRGRDADPADATEVLVNETFASHSGLGPGDEAALRTLAPDQPDAWTGISNEPDRGPRVEVTIVGVVRTAEDVSDGPEGLVLLTDEFVERHQADVLQCSCLLSLHADPTQVDEVVAAVRAEAEPKGFTVLTRAGVMARRIDQSVSLESNALRLAAIVGGIAALFVLAQVLARHVAGQNARLAALPALGATSRQQTQLWTFALAPAVLVGGVGAAVLSVALSRYFPRGLAAMAEPSPGVRVDVPVVVLGTVAVVVVGLAAVIAVAVAATRQRPVRSRRVVTGPWPSALPASGVVGVRMAGRGATGLGRAVPVLAALGGAGAIAGVIAVTLVQQSVERVVASPAAFGADWDHELTAEPEDPDAVIASVLAVDSVEAMSLMRGVTFASPRARGPKGEVEVQVLTFENLRGEIVPVLQRGRAAADEDDLVVGEANARALGVGVGDEVLLSVGSSAGIRFMVSGFGRLPDGDDTDRSLFVTMAGMERLVAGQAELDVQGAHLRFASGAPAADVAKVEALGFTPTAPPSSVDNLREMGDVPWLVAWALVVLGAGAVGHELVMGARRSRRDLAVARALGFTRGQVVASSRWHAAAVVAIVVLLGVPVGLVAGRLLWGGLASGVSVDPIVVIPWRLTALAVVVAVTAALIMAEGVGIHSCRRRAAVVLRDE